mmetsp:Transcript_11475/g.43074  ORF Transcript_11475/g.43074 Transcript_11475/m.43074 type:complete len:104 (+) Transcript_11475:1221-1532(+)
MEVQGSEVLKFSIDGVVEAITPKRQFGVTLSSANDKQYRLPHDSGNSEQSFNFRCTGRRSQQLDNSQRERCTRKHHPSTPQMAHTKVKHSWHRAKRQTIDSHS